MNKQNRKLSTKEITLIAFLAALIAFTGTFKIPGIIPGTEFQLSAPVAVAIVACFGFKRYFIGGILASIINFILGTHTILNIAVAMTFRVVAGGVIFFLGSRPTVITLSGPIGTFCGRVVLWMITGTSFNVLIIATLPGMLYTAILSYFIYSILFKTASSMGLNEFIVSKNGMFFRKRG